MARTGRPPKAIEQRRAEGNPGGRELPAPLLLGGREAPVCPFEDGDVARPMWDELIHCLSTGFILDRIDAGMVEATAVTWARARQARESINRQGLTIMVTKRSRGGDEWEEEEPNPAVLIERNAWAQFRQLADHLGIGPAARARLANMGVRGKPPEAELPGIGKLLHLKAVPGGKAPARRRSASS